MVALDSTRELPAAELAAAILANGGRLQRRAAA